MLPCAASRDRTIKLWDLDACEMAVNLDPLSSVTAHDVRLHLIPFSPTEPPLDHSLPASAGNLKAEMPGRSTYFQTYLPAHS